MHHVTFKHSADAFIQSDLKNKVLLLLNADFHNEVMDAVHVCHFLNTKDLIPACFIC